MEKLPTRGTPTRFIPLSKLSRSLTQICSTDDDGFCNSSPLSFLSPVENGDKLTLCKNESLPCRKDLVTIQAPSSLIKWLASFNHHSFCILASLFKSFLKKALGLNKSSLGGFCLLFTYLDDQRCENGSVDGNG